jgi:serine/threonine protein kinase
VQEARAASALNHPNILTIYEIGQFENWRFIATEYIAGETLRDRVRRSPLDLREIADVFGQTAAALEAAHRAGIIHRDIKPENIMIRPDGLVKVLDFGLAKLAAEEAATADSGERGQAQINTVPGLVMGTVAYMSPEQARGLRTDARTDVWSLGVCLSETVFGAQPFAGETASDQIAAILKSEPESQTADAPPKLRRIIEKCLEKRAENRYQTIGDFLQEVRNLNQESNFSSGSGFSFAPAKTFSGGKQIGRSVSAPPPGVSNAERIRGGIKRPRILTIAASIIVALALVSILYFAVFKSFFAPQAIHSIAVLPFANESGDPQGEYLSDGLSDSLMNKLSGLPQLKVAARGAAFQYKNKSADSREIARALNVEAIVTGRVAMRGDDLQIGVELINARDDTQMWGETYHRKVADAQQIQEEIAQTVLQKLRLKLSGAQQQRLNAPITANHQAYQLYLNGVFYRRQNGLENVKKPSNIKIKR